MALFIRLTHADHENAGMIVHVNMDRILTMVRFKGATLLMADGLENARAIDVKETPDEIGLMMAQERVSLPL